jgi:hypothetical protein
MSEAHRIFSVEEASGLVPLLELELGRIARLRSELAPLIASMGGSEEAVAVLEERSDGPAELAVEVAQLRDLAGKISAAVQRITKLGCIIKDLENGLVDFYSLRGTDPIFLCWQFGERTVSHWHAVDEGFSGRRSIEGLAPEPPEFPN